MATITAGDFRNGVTFEYDNDVCQVIEFQHVKPGKGAAFVRTKYKRIMNGGIREESFNPTAKFETAYIERKEVQYLYDDGEAYNFMDQETFDQFAMPHEEVEDRMKFVKEEMTVKIMSYKGKIFDLEPPLFVELEVTETGLVFKATLLQVLQSHVLLKQVLRLTFRCSLKSVTRFRLIQEQANI